MLKRGGLRLLTTGEKCLARELYRDTVQYGKVWVHHGSYLPFGMQEKNTAMTPNGEMWFETNVYLDDYSVGSVGFKHLFLHEMMHVWQYQRGMNVRLRGLASWLVNYKYDLDKDTLSQYSMEQQACIVSDYWLLIRSRLKEYKRIANYKRYEPTESAKSVIEKYKKVLRGFPQ